MWSSKACVDVSFICPQRYKRKGYPVFPAVYVGGNTYKLKVKLVSALYGVQESTNNVLERGKHDHGLKSLLDEKKFFFSYSSLSVVFYP